MLDLFDKVQLHKATPRTGESISHLTMSPKTRERRIKSASQHCYQTLKCGGSELFCNLLQPQGLYTSSQCKVTQQNQKELKTFTGEKSQA